MRLVNIGFFLLGITVGILAPISALGQNDPRSAALAAWYFGDGINGETMPLTTSGTVGYNVVPTGLGARPNRLAAQLTAAYFNANTNVAVSGNQLTLYLRARVPDGSWNSGLLAKRGSLATLSYNLFSADLPNTSGLDIGFELNTENGFIQLSFPLSRVDATAWHNLVARYDGTNAELFCDDRLMASTPLTGKILQNGEPTLIGAETDSGSIVRPFTGFMEEAAVWNTALDDEQLAYLNNFTATNDAYPTQLLHYRNPNHDVGDVHIRFDQGNWDVVYQYNIGGYYYQAQLISRDFLHWTWCDPTHAPVNSPDVLPTWFAIESVWDPLLNKWRSVWGYSGMRSSISNDRFNWYASTPQLLLADPGGYLRFSDPSITQVASNSWQMVMTMLKSNEFTGGSVGWATSSNLTDWDFHGDLYFPGNRGAPEVPTLFKMGNKWYLLESWYRGAVGRPTYQIAESPTGPWTEVTPNTLDGADVCAATSETDGNRRILLGWIPFDVSASQHWGGHICFPREIFQNPDGALRARLPSDFGNAIRGPQLFPGLANPSSKSGIWSFEGSQINCFSGAGSGTNRAILPGLFDRFDADATFTLQSGALNVGWILNWQESGSFFEVGLDQSRQLLFIRTAGGLTYASANVPVTFDSSHRLRVIVEQDMVETFYDDQFALAARIPVKLLTTSVGLFVNGGPVNFSNVTVNRLKNLESIPSDAPTVCLARNSTNLFVSFTGILQTASHLQGPYSDLAGPVSPMCITLSDTNAFWRARAP